MMDVAKIKAKGDAALAQISNALDDLEYSPDQRPVPLLRLAMDYVRDIIAELGQEVGAVDFPPELKDRVDRLQAKASQNASSPAHTSEARDAELLDWLRVNEFDLVTRREDIGEDEYAIWWFVVDYRKSTRTNLHTVSGHPLGSPREAIIAAMERQNEGAT